MATTRRRRGTTATAEETAPVKKATRRGKAAPAEEEVEDEEEEEVEETAPKKRGSRRSKKAEPEEEPEDDVEEDEEEPEDDVEEDEEEEAPAPKKRATKKAPAKKAAPAKKTAAPKKTTIGGTAKVEWEAPEYEEDDFCKTDDKARLIMANLAEKGIDIPTLKAMKDITLAIQEVETDLMDQGVRFKWHTSTIKYEDIDGRVYANPQEPGTAVKVTGRLNVKIALQLKAGESIYGTKNAKGNFVADKKQPKKK